MNVTTAAYSIIVGCLPPRDEYAQTPSAITIDAIEASFRVPWSAMIVNRIHGISATKIPEARGAAEACGAGVCPAPEDISAIAA